MAAHFPPPPPAAVTRLLARFDRDQLEGFIEVAIDLLDLGEDDPDAPDFRQRSDGLPGDPADHEPAGDDRDVSWSEQFSRTARADGPTAFVTSEDQEDGADAEDDSDAEAGTLAEFGCNVGLRPWAEGENEEDGLDEAALAHRDRIRRTRCTAVDGVYRLPSAQPGITIGNGRSL